MCRLVLLRGTPWRVFGSSGVELLEIVSSCWLKTCIPGCSFGLCVHDRMYTPLRALVDVGLKVKSSTTAIEYKQIGAKIMHTLHRNGSSFVLPAKAKSC